MSNIEKSYDIEFYSEVKKKPNFESILYKLSKKYENFTYDENLLGELYKLKGKIGENNDYLLLDIFVSKDFFDKNRLRLNDIKYIERQFRDNEEYLSLIKKENKLFKYVINLYDINKFILYEINSYILNKPISIISFRHNAISVEYVNESIEKIINFIKNSKTLNFFLERRGHILNRDIDKKLYDILKKEIDELKKLAGDGIDSDLLNSDFELTIEVKTNTILDFLITKFVQVDTQKIEELFEKLSKQSTKEANTSKRWFIWITIVIIIYNACLVCINYKYLFNIGIGYNIISIYIPFLIIEILLFKYLFFFFDRYNTYSKISSIYDYYQGLVKADKIYTVDKKFTQEQNFILREKTYLELINLSTHLKGIIDKKTDNSKEIINFLKEIKEIHPFLNTSIK